MKQSWLYFGAALILAGLVAVPFRLGFGKDIITDAITQAKVNLCINSFNTCTSQCSARATSVPGSYSLCMQDCSMQYNRCMNGIARQAPKGPSPGVSPRPSIAPPKSTPRKIPVERTSTRATAKSTSKAVAKPTATPKPAKK